VARYDHGYGLLSRTDGIGAAFYTFQAIGHTSELTGTGGAVLNSYAYDPFGVSLDKSETVANPFEYVGEYGVTQEMSGFFLTRSRPYSASVGRFLQEDSLGILGGRNLYAYTENSPNQHIDPLGTCPDDVTFDQIINKAIKLVAIGKSQRRCYIMLGAL
jgi:RHS repeat-associated protein